MFLSRCHSSAEEKILSNLFQQDGQCRVEQESEGGAGDGGKGKGASEEALVRVLRELATVQRNLANLQVELQGRQVRSFLISFCLSVFRVALILKWQCIA